MAGKNDDQGRYKTLTRRAVILGGVQAALLTGLAGRLYYLQVIESDRFAMLAEDNRINLRLIPPPRGFIVDRNGLEMARNEPAYRAVMVPEQAGDLDEALAKIARLVPLKDADYARVEKEVARKRGFLPVTVKEDITWEEVSRLEVNAPDLPGVSIQVGEKRIYPYGPSMAHVVGYVAAVSEKDLTGDPLLEVPGFRIGKSGIERRYDLLLRGEAGTSQVEVNAVGRIIREVSREKAEPGPTLGLTLDAGLQSYAHGRLSAERSASAVVMDIHNGAVLALASHPSYQPNDFTFGLSAKKWHDYITDPLTPLNNKATAGLYAPGSTFKMMVALAALKAGIGPSHRVYCPGHMELGDTRFHCWKRWGHGWMTMNESIKQSCDVYFYDLSKRVGIDNIAEMAKRFGIGVETGIDLPGEKAGTMPTRGWKVANIGEPWQLGETLVTAIGQGFVLASPLQLAVMTARIANGGKAVTPHLVAEPELARAAAEAAGEAPPEDAPLPLFESPDMGIPPEHMKIVQKAMDSVTNELRGTAYRARIQEEGWEMAGKTGTSQVRRITKAERAAGVTKNEDLPWRRRDHALFVAFAPVHQPRYCCAVVVEHGGGGSKAAAPIARDILRETQRRDPLGTTPDGPLASLDPQES